MKVALEELNKELHLKASLKDVITLFDQKASLDELSTI